MSYEIALSGNIMVKMAWIAKPYNRQMNFGRFLEMSSKIFLFVMSAVIFPVL